MCDNTYTIENAGWHEEISWTLPKHQLLSNHKHGYQIRLVTLSSTTKFHIIFACELRMSFNVLKENKTIWALSIERWAWNSAVHRRLYLMKTTHLKTNGKGIFFLNNQRSNIMRMVFNERKRWKNLGLL